MNMIEPLARACLIALGVGALMVLVYLTAAFVVWEFFTPRLTDWATWRAIGAFMLVLLIGGAAAVAR